MQQVFSSILKEIQFHLDFAHHQRDTFPGGGQLDRNFGDACDFFTWAPTCRVWFTFRVTGSHNGVMRLLDKYKIQPTGKKVYGAPEAMSLTFNAEGKITSATGGLALPKRLSTI